MIRLLSHAPQPYPDLIERLTPRLGLPTTATPGYYPYLLDSLFSLMAVARRGFVTPNQAQLVLPWVTLRFQVWFRELRRMVASVEATPQLLFSTDLTHSISESGERKPPKNLPIVHCRDCGATGWGGLRPYQSANRLDICDLNPFYQAYFNQSPLLTFIFPCEAHVPDRWLLCGQCLTLNATPAEQCRSCGHRELISVQVPDTSRDQTENGQPQRITSRDCPYCHSPSGLAIVGAQAASLTSAIIGVLFTTPFNTDKKLITFSDSVQDAAHRAGFYSARTYRTTLRTAIAQLIQARPNLTLQTLLEQFPTHWQTQLGSETDYVATFLPNDLAWLREWDQYVQSDGLELSRESILVRLVNQRLAWEIVNQFGHRSAVGPSLERSAICATYFDLKALETATHSLHSELSNQFESLRQLQPETTRQFILGILHHLRQRGGLLQPATDQYIENGGNTYLWSRLLYMPSIGPGVPRPIFFATAAAQANGFEVVYRSENRPTWCSDWARRCLAATSLLLNEQLGPLLHLTLEHLVQAGLLEKRPCSKSHSQATPANHRQAWGIPLPALHLESGGTALTCSHCRHQITASEPEYPNLLGMICLNRGCIGTYQPDQRTGLAYYRDIYRYGQVERINANEHTGLLTRPNREALEHRFIQARRRCDPNLISATSTLEMGINIGNLSSIVLCSVPPGPANYQQRIGRAGRRDGNALTSVVANGKPHDLYFYADPLKMLNGTVEAAGCYLDASAILQRQLTAFCLDHWVATSLPRNALPAQLSHVLNALERQNLQAFPYTWLDYIQTHQTQLLTEFLALFSDTTDCRTQDELRQFMEKGEIEQGGLRFRVLNALEGIGRERTRLGSQISGLGAKLKRLRDQPAALQNQERMEEMQREQNGFKELRKQLNHKQTLNFFTDEGLLPNYAFPEAGVTLRSILWRKRETKDQGDGKKYETYPITYERPGQLAIRELVPNGVFYAEGRKVTIDQIDLNLTEPEEWRFCRSCHFAVRTIEPEAAAKACPRCQDTFWSDHAQVKRMLRLKQVMATTSDRESRFGDDSDVRNPAFFQRHLLVDFKPEFRLKTFVIQDHETPFGFEYIERTSFRELNLGEPQRQAESSLHMAGREFTSSGFKVCRSCGKVMRGHSRRDHTIGCQYWDKPDQAKAMDVLYLYREFESEAIRFLMPDENFWTLAGIHSFVAALQLGLKQKFGGQVNHLQTTIAEEPQPNSTLSKSFLYLYDTVPGGTGYLRQLIRNPAEMRDVFQKSLSIVRACRCQEDGKDGCYECLFAYRTSFDLDQTSRKKAQTLLSTILKQWDSLNETSAGLASIRLNVNFDSELERGFIDAISAYQPPPPTPGLEFRKDIFNGKTGYYLEIGDISWIIETQVSLDERFGVDSPSRVDFLIRPASQQNPSKPIAVFTDGWQYHQDRITQDIQQRLAIIRSQQFWCWSLTWDDIPHLSKSGQPQPLIGLISQLNVQFQNNPGLSQKYGCEALAGLETQNSFVWLMHYLMNPDQKLWTRLALLRTLAQANPSTLQNPDLKQAWSQTLATKLGPDLLEEWQLGSLIMTNTIFIRDCLDVWLAIDLTRHQALEPTGSFVLLDLNQNLTSAETFRLAWREALRLQNLYQFLPNFYVIADDNPVDKATTRSTHSASSAPDPNTQNPQWDSLRELVLDENLLSMIDLMADQQWPLPEIGYELTAKNGQVIADAELAWVSPQIAILLEPDAKQIWQKQGWFTQTVTELIQSPEAIHKKLRES